MTSMINQLHGGLQLGYVATVPLATLTYSVQFNSIQFNISLLPFLVQVKRWNFPSAETSILSKQHNNQIVSWLCTCT
jgi:hypothetical protein